jgi:hypothetical protein
VTVLLASPVEGAAVAVGVTAGDHPTHRRWRFPGAVNGTVMARVVSALRVVLDLDD